MFRKLISNVSFSPALIGQLSFYAKRLRREEATRRAGLIFTALALVVQSFAVFSPPEPANAASNRDFIKGGVTSVQDFLKHYDKNDQNLRDMMNYTGITRSEIAKAKKTTANSKDGWLSWGRTSPFSASQGDVKHKYRKSNGGTGTMHSKPLRLWDTTSWSKKYGSKYVVFEGHSKKLGKFAIMAACANVMTKKLPPKPPKPPVPPKPIASCSNLDVIRSSDTQRRFKASAKVDHGATISKYSFVISNSTGKTVKTFDYRSSSSTVTTGDITLPPGKYSVQMTVVTSIGSKTGANCRATFTLDTPGITITKTVNDREHISVALNQPFTYNITVTNTGKTTLNKLKVTDAAPKTIEFISADIGPVSPTDWSHEIPTLASGKSLSFAIKAKATQLAEPGSTIIKNTACVETSDITGNPDACDDASVEVPETTITVCDLTTDKTLTIKKSDYNESIHSKNPEDCVKIQVCDTISGAIVTIRKPEFDKNTQTEDLKQCEDMQVCELQSGEVIVIKQSQFDANKHSEDAANCIPDITSDKKGVNISQGNQDASKVLANSNDRIQYTITVRNVGDVVATASFKEDLQDVLEYAKLIDNGGGTFNSDNKTLSWDSTDLQPGESKSRMFVVQLASTIPAGARGVSDPSSYDCIITNTFGNTVNISVSCPAPKQIEQTVAELPTTGPGENMLFAGVLLAVVAYFYLRSRQMVKEVRYIRKDLNAGTI